MNTDEIDIGLVVDICVVGGMTGRSREGMTYVVTLDLKIFVDLQTHTFLGGGGGVVSSMPLVMVVLKRRLDLTLLRKTRCGRGPCHPSHRSCVFIKHLSMVTSRRTCPRVSRSSPSTLFRGGPFP